MLKGSLDNFSILTSFFKAFLISLVVALIALALLEYSEHRFLATFYPKEISLQNYIISSFVANKNIKELDNGIYINLAQILAALAGIYFATISIIASTSYSSLSREVRNLIWEEKLNSFYFTMLVSLIAILLILAGIHAYGYTTGTIIFVTIVLLTIIAVLGFVHVSISLFSFFDPTTLLERQILPEIFSLIKKATVNGVQWNIPEIQNYYRKRADSSLDIYQHVVDGAFRVWNTSDKVKILYAGQLQNLLGATLKILRFYAFHKTSIPIESCWFKKIYQQQKWFAASSTYTDIALQTGGSLQPEEMPDNMWFEKQLSTIIVKLFETALLSKDLKTIAELYNVLQQYLEYITKEHSPHIAIFIFDKIRPISNRLISDIDLTKDDYEDVEGRLAIALAVADCYSMCPLSIIMGYRKGFEDFEKPKLLNALGSIKWLTDSGIYKHRFPQEIADQLRYIQKGLVFEAKIEGKIISPAWFQLQLATIGALKYICSIPDSILTLIEKEYVTFSSTLIEQKKYLIALQVIGRGLESCSKCESHFKYLAHLHADLESTQKVADIPKPNIDWEKVGLRLEQCRENLVKNFAELSPETINIPEHPSIPDYFGMEYWLIAQECFRCILANKHELFKILFPTYFLQAFSVYDRLTKKYNETKVEYWAVQQMDVICDLLALSGYALVYGELGNREIWSTVKTVWKNYIGILKKQGQDTDSWIYTVPQVALGRDHIYSISNRGIIQHSWLRLASNDLTRKGILSEERHYYHFGMEDEGGIKNHSSAIVEYVVRHASLGSWYQKPEDIFSAVFLLPLMPDNLVQQIGEKLLRLEEGIKEIAHENLFAIIYLWVRGRTNEK